MDAQRLSSPMASRRVSISVVSGEILCAVPRPRRVFLSHISELRRLPDGELPVGHAASGTRLRSRSNLARPYICLLIAGGRESWRTGSHSEIWGRRAHPQAAYRRSHSILTEPIRRRCGGWVGTQSRCRESFKGWNSPRCHGPSCCPVTDGAVVCVGGLLVSGAGIRPDQAVSSSK
jgi:hypothetical protein